MKGIQIVPWQRRIQLRLSTPRPAQTELGQFIWKDSGAFQKQWE